MRCFGARLVVCIGVRCIYVCAHNRQWFQIVDETDMYAHTCLPFVHVSTNRFLGELCLLSGIVAGGRSIFTRAMRPTRAGGQQCTPFRVSSHYHPSKYNYTPLTTISDCKLARCIIPATDGLRGEADDRYYSNRYIYNSSSSAWSRESGQRMNELFRI